MNVKDFIYNEDLSDIHKVFLYYNIAHVSTTITSIRKNAYRENDFKFDCKQNFLLKFPEFNDYEFEEFWKNIINKFSRFDIDYFEEMGLSEAELIYKIACNQIYNFIIKKVKNLNEEEINLTLEFLKKGPDDTKVYNIEYLDQNGDFFISFGFLYKGAYYNSNGYLEKSNYYYYPYYFSDLKYKIIRYIETSKPIEKEKKKEEIEQKIPPSNKEHIYKLKVIHKGKKEKKKLKFGITQFGVGAEFGGQEQETIELKCGNCGKSDKFIIEDQEGILLRCGKCGKLNKPIGKDINYFE